MGTFFTNREVKTVGRHIGLTEKNYRIVDLSEDLEEYSFAGKLGNHYVNREWKNADFRIAFAKNKTHTYAFYTLTIKDIYGALPMENKFLDPLPLIQNDPFVLISNDPWDAQLVSQQC